MAETTIPRTNEIIDKLNEFRLAHGQESLPYEIEGEAAKVEDKKEDAPHVDEKNDATPVNETPIEDKKEGAVEQQVAAVKTPEKVEMTKEEKEALIKEYLGVSDLSEIIKKSEIKKEPTEAEVEAAFEKRESDKISYALAKGKFTQKELTSYIADATNTDLAFQQYSQEQLAADSTLSALELREEFEEKFGLNQEEDSRKYKRGQAEIAIITDNILRQRHGKVIGFDSEYTSIENSQLSEKQLSEKILSEAPKYKKDVEEIYSDLKKIKISFGEGEDYEYETPASVLDNLKERELNSEFAASEIKTGYTKENKAAAAKLAIIHENLPAFIKSIADKINSKRQAGARGIPPQEGAGKQEETKKRTPEQQEQIDRIYGKQVPVAN